MSTITGLVDWPKSFVNSYIGHEFQSNCSSIGLDTATHTAW